MLIITRRPGEKIVLGDDITLMVMEVSGQTVRLGIDAPKSLPDLPRGDLGGGQAGERGGRQRGRHAAAAQAP